MFRKLFTVAAVVSLSVMGAAPAQGLRLMEARVMKPCTAEDSSKVYPCLWDATKRGNGKGWSYVRYTPEHVEFVPDIIDYPQGYDEWCERTAKKHYRCYITR